MADEFVSSTGDERTVNNTARQQYRVLSEPEKQDVDYIKQLGDDFLTALAIGDVVRKERAAREFAIARTKIEEAVMWAVKGITK